MENHLKFEWDDEKEEANIIKHKMNFKMAELVFNDDNRIEDYDEVHSREEDRFITIGFVAKASVFITVVYTMRGERIRIISARKATRTEKEEYYHVNYS